MKLMAEASVALRASLLASLGLGKALHEINDILESYWKTKRGQKSKLLVCVTSGFPYEV